MPATKIVVSVLKMGEPAWADRTVPHQIAYCRRHGYDYILGGAERTDNRGISWHKLRNVRRDIGDADWLVLMDLDMMPTPWARPLEQFLVAGMISLAPDLPQRGRAKAILRAAGYKPEYHRWNAGLICCHRDRIGWLAELWDADWRHWAALDFNHEQEALNQRIGREKIPVAPLPETFNRMWRRTVVANDIPGSDIIHFAGDRDDAGRMRRIEIVEMAF